MDLPLGSMNVFSRFCAKTLTMSTYLQTQIHHDLSLLMKIKCHEYLHHFFSSISK